MNRIEKRIQQAEEALNMGQGLVVVNVVWFGGEPVPPERRRDNIIIRHVAYESVREQMEKASRP